MYGFWRLGLSPAPSAGATCASNGLETTTSMKAKNVATRPRTGTTHGSSSGAQRRRPRGARSAPSGRAGGAWPSPHTRLRSAHRARGRDRGLEPRARAQALGALFRDVLGRALRPQRVLLRDEDAVLEPTLDAHLAADLEQIRHRPAVDDRDARAQSRDVAHPEAQR